MKMYNIVQILAREGIYNAIKKYGIEGTEEKIKSIYEYTPKLKNYLLKEYRDMLQGKKL